MQRTLAIVMAGGSGERLRPLTQERAKPAVPFGGKFRLIDFTLSNCVNSGIRQIFVLTQYKSASLNRHLQEGWGISSSALGDYVYTVPAQQKVGESWYGGTADAVWQNLDLVRGKNIQRILILSGDHVYKADYSRMLDYHTRKDSQLTISVVSVRAGEAAGKLGVLEVDPSGKVLGFEEKPMRPKTRVDAPDQCFASMGIYIFSIDALMTSLHGSEQDFGKEVIPAMIRRGEKILVYPYETENQVGESIIQVDNGRLVKTLIERSCDSSYWRDVGEIDSYFEASMDLLGDHPPFNLNAENWPFRTYQRPLPPCRCVLGGATCGSLVSDGCVIKASRVDSSVLSPGVMVERDSVIEGSIIFDNVVVGPGVRIRRAIIDKGATVQPRAFIGYDREADIKRGCVISQTGVVVVPKRAVIEPA